MITHIIWDLDGTLTNTLTDLMLSTNYVLRQHGMPERTLEQIRCAVGNGVRRLLALSIPNGEQNPQFEDCFEQFKVYYKAHCRDNTSLYPGIADTLLLLKQKGLHMAIVSNKLQAGVDELYEMWFEDTIEVAIGEREGVKRKPAPDMVHLAMKQMNASAESTIYIGDSEVDILTAKNAGLRCISVLWGFRDKAFLKENGGNLFATTPQDILSLVC